MIVKLLTEQRLEFLSLKGGCTGSSESIFVKNATLLEMTCRGSIILVSIQYNMGLIVGVSDQVMLKPACSATETSYNLRNFYEESLDIIRYESDLQRR